ncbi:high mobility group protein 20A [Hyalella azteca]|uniref:High mobility group protein 20A n=1 Tax=Hyalella azteca TaxID=294128 RepID=A0A8B7NL60_HYAAZ|nr:high mobility group protein 20A [Hyalella azteca]
MAKVGNSGENGSTGHSQADLLKLLSSNNANQLSSASIGALGSIGGLAASPHARQNGSALMRSYEALLQNSARLPPQAAVPSIPGPTRRRKKKRRRQPDMPKKACTPFMHFCSYFKKKLMEEGKEFPQFADFGKRAGELWRNMADTEKVQFNELSEKDRQRYIKDMKEYEERKLAEKEREQELQQQRDKELHVLREKEMERLQKQRHEQLEHQQKQMEHHKQQMEQTQAHQPQAASPTHSNAALMNMLNPLSPLNPLMMAALNQSLMQTMITNPELFKTMYSEAAKNYYLESLKNYYQNSPLPQSNGCSTSVSTSGCTTLTYSPPTDMHSPLSTNPLGSMNMNLNLLSLINSGQLSSQSMSATNGNVSPPAGKSPTLTKVSGSSPIGTPNNMASAALDLSSARLERGGCTSDEELINQDDCEIEA